jgi:hypothetical protein
MTGGESELSAARLAVRQLEKAAQEWVVRFREERPVHRASTATRNRAESDHQKLAEGVQIAVPGSRVL